VLKLTPSTLRYQFLWFNVLKTVTHLFFFFHSIFSLFIPSFASSSSYGSVLPIDLAAVKHLRWQDLSEMKWNQRRLPEAIDDVMAGQISCIFGNADVWRKHIKINETKTSNSKKMILHHGLLCVTFVVADIQQLFYDKSTLCYLWIVESAYYL
jgi:hypothetical protein